MHVAVSDLLHAFSALYQVDGRAVRDFYYPQYSRGLFRAMITMRVGSGVRTPELFLASLRGVVSKRTVRALS